MSEQDKNQSIFQRLNNAIKNNWGKDKDTLGGTNGLKSYQLTDDDKKILFKTTDKAEYDKVFKTAKQDQFLDSMWRNTGKALDAENLNNLNRMALMYRDVDMMDGFPEIGAALDILAEESVLPDDNGNIVHVYSSSDRVKTILEDLFTNRLQINSVAAMIIRGTAKYGNQFYCMNMNSEDGITGWRQLPVTQVERIEGNATVSTGALNASTVYNNIGKTDKDSNEVKFAWTCGDNTVKPYRNWQIAHFRLLTDCSFLPYGCSYLHKARRHWRMLSLMEDMMLIYRLDRSMERRIYKLYVGGIDPKDVPAYIQQFANRVKRTQIVDPMTGQIDLRKNILSNTDDYFIPFRDANAADSVENLTAGQNMTALDDIKYVQSKVLTGLEVPKEFLNFDQAAGNGQNLAMMDIRFTRKINRMQQAFLEELTKVATIHLYLLGFLDDLTNFTLTMNNPSTQAEQMEVETMQKKVSIIRDCCADPGVGIPILSMEQALKKVLKMSDKDIEENWLEIRKERALSEELKKTNQIITRTGIFDKVDRELGIPNAKYQDEDGAQGGDSGQGGPEEGGMPGGGGDFGGGMPDMGGGPEMGGGPDMGGGPAGAEGGEGEMPPEEAGPADEMAAGPQEGKKSHKPLINEDINIDEDNLENIIYKDWMKSIQSSSDNKKRKIGETIVKRKPIYNKNFAINEEFNDIEKELKNIKKKLK